MKKLILSAFALLTFGFANAQEGVRFGVKGGLDLAQAKVKYDTGFGTYEATESETGFFVGGFAEIGLTEKFSLQPEIYYVGINDFDMISLPVLAKFEFVPNFHALVGPSFNYLLDAGEGVDDFKVNLDFGASYDITEDFDVSAKYSVGFGDFSINGLFIGAGYKF